MFVKRTIVVCTCKRLKHKKSNIIQFDDNVVVDLFDDFILLHCLPLEKFEKSYMNFFNFQ